MKNTNKHLIMPIKPLVFALGVLAFTNTAFAAEQTLEQQLGQLLYEDINLSLHRNQSCESCHSLSTIEIPIEGVDGNFQMAEQPTLGFVDPSNVLNGTAVSDGSRRRAFGGLNAPSVGYAAFSPDFHWDGELFIGGQFWNGRASNLVEQAKGPFVNPLEMAMPSEWAVIERLKQNRSYLRSFKRIYNIDLRRLREGNPKVGEAYEAVATAISAFERTSRFNRFDSKFDFEAAGITQYNASEQRGADLFDDIAQCGDCHSTDEIDGESGPALLTDFSYDNIGSPANPQIPRRPQADPGLQGNPNIAAVHGNASELELDEVQGRHKVMSLRNIAMTAPYMHNGVFKSLREVVHFYNTRDVLPACTAPADATNPGFAVTCWPQGEFHSTRNTKKMGNLGLTPQDEADIVEYMKTFTDNYPEWGNSNGLSDPNVPTGTPSPFANYPIPDHSN